MVKGDMPLITGESPWWFHCGGPLKVVRKSAEMNEALEAETPHDVHLRVATLEELGLSMKMRLVRRRKHRKIETTVWWSGGTGWIQGPRGLSL